MAALDALNAVCERRGWRILLTGCAHYPDGTPAPPNMPAMLLDGLEVRGPIDRFLGNRRELLARVPIDGLADTIDYDAAAADLARALARQGLNQ
jgi:hypothetical protein